jgi:DNA polymerase-3 subunit gamma/tau
MFSMADALFPESEMTPPAAPAAASPYLVLARKYRPSSFASLIGQDAMVQTLRNAFRANRIPHAFMLTGIRGVGKTTTARILARAVNFEDETGRHPTLDLDREGIHDRAIIEGRHVDVLEMDAASNTGINDIREIIDSVKYGPVSAPYKVYIIDEVHMLSTAAFNGLLKTLEEPPPYVKFIFATTEIRKVPVTILSRCMRFDLRRVPPETMTAHLVDLLGKEGIAYEPEALAMIVRAGEGSVRDNQSLLDQAISHGDGKVTAATVKAMLGLGDRARSIDLFEALMRGDVASALTLLRELYDAGADPETVISDLADFTNLVTRIKVVPAAADDVSLTPDERTRGPQLSQKLGMRALSRAWQILFRGLEEIRQAGNGLQAAEMVLVRLAYASELPSPDELIGRLQSAPQGAGGGASVPHRGAIGSGPQAAIPRMDAAPRYAGATVPARQAAPEPQAAPLALASPRTYL